MYPVFVLLMMISLLLPAVPVSGCECGQDQSSTSKQSCCCSSSASDQKQKQKSCCCSSAKQRDKKGTIVTKQTQCQKQSCHCHRIVSQPAIIASVKSTELTEQLNCLVNSVDLTEKYSLSAHNVTALTFETSQPVRSYSAGELCAHYCLWLI